MSPTPSTRTPQARLNNSSPAANDVGLGDIVNELINTVNTLRADHNTLAAKLNADAGVTDTNYATSGVASALTILNLR